MRKAKQILQKRKELGASLVEYGLVVALVAVICIGGIGRVGKKVDCQIKNGSVGFTGNPVADCAACN